MERAAAPAPSPLDQARRPDGAARNLLTRPAFGAPDDLKRISGVGPVLERMLHGLGVFYFWQVAEWSPEDVRNVDEVLTAFKGRIERDNWVRQARALSAEPTAATRPVA